MTFRTNLVTINDVINSSSNPKEAKTRLAEDLQINLTDAVLKEKVLANVYKLRDGGKTVIRGGYVFGNVFESNSTDSVIQIVKRTTSIFHGDRSSIDPNASNTIVEGFSLTERKTSVDSHVSFRTLRGDETKLVSEVTVVAATGKYANALVEGPYQLFFNSNDPAVKAKARTMKGDDPMTKLIDDATSKVSRTARVIEYTITWTFDRDGNYSLKVPYLGINLSGKKAF